MILADSFYYGESKWLITTKHYQVKAGLAKTVYSVTFEADITDAKRSMWKKFESFASDYFKTVYAYYPNGTIWTKNHHYREREDVWPSIGTFYDSTGVVVQKSERLFGQLHGSVELLLSDSSTLLLQYLHGTLDAVQRDGAVFFTTQNEKCTFEAFKSELIVNRLNRSMFCYKTNYNNDFLVFYAFDTACSEIILKENICLTEARKSELIQRVKKL